jgi:hypothetical protein
MSDTPESVREVVTGLYWADAKLSEVRAAIEALERYAELLEQHAALKARVEEYRVGWDRYETLRLLNPRAFIELSAAHLRNMKPFDQMVDELKIIVRPKAPRESSDE